MIDKPPRLDLVRGPLRSGERFHKMNSSILTNYVRLQTHVRSARRYDHE